jgi:4-alpha-glucanotransferase
MNQLPRSNSIPMFPPTHRASGVLLHVTSLPSAYGVGDIGPTAYAWVNRLRDAGQSWWQALPLGPTGYGNSPYQSLSTFAGNGLLISPDLLIEEELLRESDCETRMLGATAVDYPAVIRRKHRLLETAWVNFNMRAPRSMRDAFERFCHQQAHWLEDYALFRALKAHYRGAHYLDWSADLVQRQEGSLRRARQELFSHIDQVRFAQFVLFRQGERLKQYAHSKGLRLIGDLPFFVSPDSSDVWANPELFVLDEKRRPRFVGGVPPDMFSEDGQLWGSPVYDWEVHRQTGYRWWIDRLRALLSHVDVVRLDHFRGFAAAWHVPAASKTARAGQWVAGPGAELFDAAAQELNGIPCIAEDLGVITPDVSALRDRFNVPGTRVLQFAFDGDSQNPHLPENYTQNTVVYTGTHDNNTSRGWFDELSESQRQNLSSHVGTRADASDTVASALMELAWSSPAALAIVPLQDLLNLGSEARMNVPGRADGNWAWRCTNEMLSATPFENLAELTHRSNRLARATDRSFNPISHTFTEVTV